MNFNSILIIIVLSIVGFTFSLVLVTKIWEKIKPQKSNNRIASDFGKGFIYSLVLFAKHFEGFSPKLERCKNKEEDETFAERDACIMWADGAFDHLREAVIPKKWEKKKIGRLAKELYNLASALRYDTEFQTEENFKKAFSLLEDLALEIDRKLGLDPEPAEWN